MDVGYDVPVAAPQLPPPAPAQLSPGDPGGMAGAVAPSPTTVPEAPVMTGGTGALPPDPFEPVEAPGMETPVEPTGCVIGSTGGSDVLMIGDSFFAQTGDIADILHDLARAQGSLPADATYRLEYVGGTQLEGGFPPTIPSQYGDAAQSLPVKTVIMTGGANDVLIGDSSCGWAPAPSGESCKATIDGAAAAAEALLAQMAADGVEKVVYMFYPHLPPGREGLNTSLDYGYTVMAPICANAPVDCYFIDQREAYAGHPEYFMFDNTHPTRAGSEVSANLIWDVMEAECIAQ